MRINQGVEWAVHACALLAPLPPDRGLSLLALAAFHGVPAPYLAKQMQALSKAGLVRASRGKTGGYCLAKSANELSLWDIVVAIDGGTPAFRCTEIRQNGPCAQGRAECRKACAIAAGFAQAEAAYRDTLRAITIADIVLQVGANNSHQQVGKVIDWYQDHVTELPTR